MAEVSLADTFVNGLLEASPFSASALFPVVASKANLLWPGSRVVVKGAAYQRGKDGGFTFPAPR